MTTQKTIDQAAQTLWDAIENADPTGYTDEECGTIDVRNVDMRSVVQALSDAGLLADGATTADLTIHLMKRHEVEAERDAALATIQRVREAAAYLHWVAAHTDDTMPHNRAIATTYNNAAQIIREALDQEAHE